MTASCPIAEVCVLLGKAGTSIAIHRGGLIFNLPGGDDSIRALLSSHREPLTALVSAEPALSQDAMDHFTERLGIADGLGMPAHVGSPAWLIALGEALASEPVRPGPCATSLQAAAAAGVPPRSQSLVALALDIFPGSIILKVDHRAPGQSLEAWK